jgi:hypothetical protein
MEIQFTIKVLASSAAAAVLNAPGPNGGIQANLGNNFRDQLQKRGQAGRGGGGGDPAGTGGGGGDPAGTGGGAPGAGQVLVIGPIVISGAGLTSAALAPTGAASSNQAGNNQAAAEKQAEQ